MARYQGKATLTVRGPETIATPAACRWAGAEFFGIVFKLGAFVPHPPPGRVKDRNDANLPVAAGHSFWLHGSAWRYPDYDNADAVFEAGYFDHAHLTLSLSRFIGQTPAQIADPRRPAQLSFLYKTAPLSPRSSTGSWCIPSSWERANVSPTKSHRSRRRGLC